MNDRNSQLPCSDDAPEPVERRLRGLRPQPLRLDAQTLVAQAQHTAGSGHSSADAEERTLPVERAPQPQTGAVAGGWSLLAVGVSGFAAGVLLTMWVLWPANRPQLTATAPPVAAPAMDDNQEPGLESVAPHHARVAADAAPQSPAAGGLDNGNGKALTQAARRLPGRSSLPGLDIWKTESPAVLAVRGVQHKTLPFDDRLSAGDQPAASLALSGPGQGPAQSSGRIRVGDLDGELLNELLFGL